MKQYITTAAACLAALSLSGCLDDTYPASGMTQEQVAESATALEALNNAIPRHMLSVGTDYSSIGYAGPMLMLEAAVGNLPVSDTSYDYLAWYCNDTYLGKDGANPYDWWNLYTGIIMRADLVINAAPAEADASKEQLAAMGNAFAYHALAYLDMARLYEYKPTGFSELDQKAEANGVYGLSVPLITENTTEDEARHNPRQPFYVIYRFINDDLTRAERYLQGFTRATANKADLAVVCGLKARMWLELATRFDDSPADLAQLTAYDAAAEGAQYEKMGVSTAADCWALAAKYAREAIDCGYYPLSQAEWHDTNLGFNYANHAWLLAMQLSSDDLTWDNASWQSWTSFLAPEAGFGVASANTYGAARMIDASLYSFIPDVDWRKRTWIDPDEAGDPACAANYKTVFTADQWAKEKAYTGFKFRPANGNLTDYLQGAAADIPLMRVEEMYLIEAEAKAHTGGLEAGKAALADFLNTYRYTDGSYVCPAATMKSFNDEIVRQKAIEFWGEGIVAYDFKRLKAGILTDYYGSNHPDAYKFNFEAGYVAPRLNVCFPSSETDYNDAIVNNPDPTSVH